MGLIFTLEAAADNPDWATIWLTGVGMPGEMKSAIPFASPSPSVGLD
jgi:hypothetical protein